MKVFKLIALMSFVLVGLNLQAQFDDLYVSSDSEEYLATVDVEETAADSDFASSDEEYEYYSEYDNYYTSRIRRFNRPAGYNYYNSYYSNDLFYDPFRSYYSPQYLTYSRVYGGYIPTRRGAVFAVTYGNPIFGRSFGSPFGFGSSFGSRGGYGCPVGPAIVTTSRVAPLTANTTTRSSYTGTRRSTANRTSTTNSSSRVQTFGRSSRTAPSSRASSSNRRSSTRASSRSTSRPSTSTRRSSSSSRSTFLSLIHI